ncbi:peptidase S8/S53 domain-containing protein [Catenaria anguillulae PL171]|uniref:Peptidase S8/S53 domain-containing protein n=1 Tax=Catenaria anguillulae PL171 TaxID=765915 RepID=A0A1Y2H9Z2_9FUNG|nr:peptidase S8/S53 domain-containing protein [Catenaria anguillulae PL171]
MAVLGINDPEFQDQWHLNNTVAVGNDVSAISAWTSKITGRNITVTLIDDGLDYTHPDLKDNFDADASYDFNLQKALPYPALTSDTHGTRCAGEIGARPGNGVCGVGLAYDAKLAGIRLLSGDITVADEVAALNYRYERVDVYSNSWGPDDDGATVAGPSRFTQQALVNAANNGRAGRGNVMVFAAGNGGEADNCNYDGFANNLYTVSIGAVDIYNEVPWYGEPCVAHMVVGYSSNENVGITTTDRGTGCANDHGGTSAATPLASAIVALILQVRPSLTVRDVHDILRKSALKITPVNNTFHTPQFVPQWTTLPSGLSHSDYFAYGRIDAARALLATRAHKPLPPRLTHKATSPVLNTRIPYSSQTSTFSMRLPVAASITVTNSTTGIAPGQGLVVERVGARVWVTHPRRGHLAFQLISPAGIVSNLATPRPDDRSNAGLPGWQFTSVKHWGEPALGEWKLAVADLGNATTNGTLVGWELEIHGHSGSLTGEVVDTTVRTCLSAP